MRSTTRRTVVFGIATAAALPALARTAPVAVTLPLQASDTIDELVAAGWVRVYLADTKPEIPDRERGSVARPKVSTTRNRERR